MEKDCGYVSAGVGESGMNEQQIRAKISEFRFPKPIKGSTRTCRICGKDFICTRSSKIPKFCSRECWRKKPSTAKPRMCQYCKKQFVRRFGSAVTFCSPQCRGKYRARILYLRCAHCRKEFTRSAYRASLAKTKINFCSQECAYAYQVGNRHHNWRGDYTKSRGRDWRKQSKAARDRDLHQCQICHKAETKNGWQAVDHIVPYRMSRTNALWNLLTACNPCHSAKTHVENKLLAGDRLGFLQDLTELGWPMEIVNEALETWGKIPQVPMEFYDSGKIGRRFSKPGHSGIHHNRIKWD